MLLKRLAGNIVDIVLFFLVFFILFKLSGLEIDSNQMSYFYFFSFFITFLFPILSIKNTIGKQLFNLHWTDDKNLKSKLILKYLFYYLSISPSFSILSAISSFPYLNSVLGNFDKILSLKILIAYLSSDLIIFIISLGKYHIIDYALMLNLKKYSFSRKPFKSLSFVYLFFGTFLIISLYIYKYDLTFSNVSNSFNSILVKEQYPSDLFYGKNVFTLKDNSENVFTPSVPLSFIYKQKIPQKTLYLNLPKPIFNSEIERENICWKLIEQSYRNDVFSDFKPTQIRIVLSNIERGFFLEYYNYFYIYYFDMELPDWGIYGGIESDSITMNNYINFRNSYNLSLQDKIKDIKEKYNLSWAKIIEKSSNDKLVKKELSQIFNYRICYDFYPDKLNISIDTTSLELKRIDFKNTIVNRYVNLNIPITDLEQRVNIVNLVNGELEEYDDNVYYLKILRDEVTNEGI